MNEWVLLIAIYTNGPLQFVTQTFADRPACEVAGAAVANHARSAWNFRTYGGAQPDPGLKWSCVPRASQREAK